MLEILMVVYQWVLVVFDLAHLWVMSFWLALVALYTAIFPVEMKSVAGKIVLVRLKLLNI